MGRLIEPQSQGAPERCPQCKASWRSLASLAQCALVVALTAGLCAQQELAAQATAGKPTATSKAAAAGHKAVHKRARLSAAHLKAQAVVAAPIVEAPKPPELPKWPVDDKANPAAVVWDSQGLRIDAENSSLQQILKDVETATGATVEGEVNDERVFGAFGPGLARDVLSQLLQGSGYNVVMIGDLGKGAPRQIVLSSRNSGDAQGANKTASANGDDDSADNDNEEQQQQQPIMSPARSGFTPGGPPRTPQQIMQEMQQRQQQGQPGRPTPP